MASRRQTRTAGNSPLNSLERMDWESLNLGELSEDPRLQMRLEGLDEKHVRDLMAVVEDKGIDEPITVIREGKTLWLADGFHRVEAYRRAAIAKGVKWEKQIIKAIVLTGTFDDAKQIARKANLRHGKALSPASRKAILFDMVRGGEEINGIAVKRLSNGVLAAELGVHQGTIGDWFKELIAEESTSGKPLVTQADRDVVYGRDMREIKVADIASSNRQTAAEAAERRAAEEAERKKNLPAVDKLRVICDMLIAKYGKRQAEKGQPFLNDPAKGFKWCQQVSNPTFVTGTDWEIQFLKEYHAKPVGLYQEFLRLVDQATFIEAEMDGWTDEQLADWVTAMRQQPRAGFGMAQPKNAATTFEQAKPLGRHQMSTSAATEPETPCPYQVGEKVRIIKSGSIVPVIDTKWTGDGWRIWTRGGGYMRPDEIAPVPASETEIEEQSEPTTPCPFQIGHNVQVIETGERGIVQHTEYINGAWSIRVELYDGLKTFGFYELNRVFGNAAATESEGQTERLYMDGERVIYIPTGKIHTVAYAWWLPERQEWHYALNGRSGPGSPTQDQLRPVTVEDEPSDIRPMGALAAAILDKAASELPDDEEINTNPTPCPYRPGDVVRHLPSDVKCELLDTKWDGHVWWLLVRDENDQEWDAPISQFERVGVLLDSHAPPPAADGAYWVDDDDLEGDGIDNIDEKIQYFDAHPEEASEALRQRYNIPAPTQGKRQAEMMVEDARSIIPRLVLDTTSATADFRQSTLVRWESPKSIQTILENGDTGEISLLVRDLSRLKGEVGQSIRMLNKIFDNINAMFAEIDSARA